MSSGRYSIFSRHDDPASAQIEVQSSIRFVFYMSAKHIACLARSTPFRDVSKDLACSQQKQSSVHFLPVSMFRIESVFRQAGFM